MSIAAGRSSVRRRGCAWLIAAGALLAACGGSDPGSTPSASTTPTPTPSDTYDVKTLGIPRFVASDYIDLARTARISKFRSGIGHDYSDDFEKCRTLKHYYVPSGGNWADVGIYSPVRGTVAKNVSEWAGSQVWIQSAVHPGITVVVTHLTPTRVLNVGDQVAEAERLGHHVGDQTMSDVAVGIKTPEGWKLVSYFDVMTDALFDRYKERGIASRGATAITKEQRDADPLSCSGETYADAGHLTNWVDLR